MRWAATLSLLVTLAALPLAGCAMQVDLPPAFLEIERESTSYKATTADDTIFWVERFGLPDKGTNRQFWVDAIQNDFVANRGYTLVENGPIATEKGDAGTQLIFEATVGGLTYRYFVALFIAPGPTAYVARFTAQKDAFDGHLDGIRQAVRTLRY